MISARRQHAETMARLKESEERLALTIAASQAGIFDWNIKTGDLLWSEQTRNIFRLGPADEVSGIAFFLERLHPQDRDRIEKEIEDHLYRKQKYETECRIRQNGGQYVWIETRGQALWDENGDPVRMVGAVLDITEKKKIENELVSHRDNLRELILEQTRDFIRAKNEAERANRAKDDFLANMSHELRTPLNTIVGLTNILLKDEVLDGDAGENLKIVGKSSKALLAIVNDILDLSRIEAGMVTLEKKPFNIIDFLRSLIAQVRPLASEKGLMLKHNMETLPDINLLGDEFRLQRILMNLLSNAVKYTLVGEIEITAAIDQVNENNALLTCRITDTGIGIDNDKLTSIFEKFTQAEETVGRRYGGTGLGLNITKQLTEMMGGQIYVESEPDKGSTFVVSVAFEITGRWEGGHSNVVSFNLPEAPRKPIGEARCLVAEDHEFNQVFALKLVERLGCQNCALVPSGKEAIKAFDKSTYDMILMDYHMPDMDGYEAAKAIRQKEKVRGRGEHVPIIAMTADVIPGTREKCMRSGMDEYISKPIDEDTFHKLMAHWFILEEDDKPANQSQKHNGGMTVDLSLLQDYAEGNITLEKDLIAVFYKKSLQHIEILGKHQDETAHRIWAEAAHALKGSAGYIGAKRMESLCQEAENSNNAPAQKRKALYRQITEEHDKICAYLRQKGLLE